MSHVLYEWEFANHICRVVESEPGIVHFEQGRKESVGDPRAMEFERTATPMGAANEIVQLHQELAEAKMLNRDLAAFYQGYQEDRNRREGELAALKAKLEEARENLRIFGWHHHGCRLVAPGSYQGDDEKYCDCGWIAVREAREGRE